MKKSILSLGKALRKAEQKEVFGGIPPPPPPGLGTCGCSETYQVVDNGHACTFNANGLFPEFVCYGTVQNDLCCV